MSNSQMKKNKNIHLTKEQSLIIKLTKPNEPNNGMPEYELNQGACVNPVRSLDTPLLWLSTHYKSSAFTVYCKQVNSFAG